MRRGSFVLLAGGALAGCLIGFLATQSRLAGQIRAADEPQTSTRPADEAALKKLGSEFVSDFDKRDAAAIAAHFTTAAEFIRNDGEAIRGRGEIQKAYAAYFKGLTGKNKMDIQIQEIRFPSNDTALLDATLRLKDEDDEVIASSWRHSLLVREGGQWMVAATREWDRDVAADVTLKELQWLIGSWQVTANNREVTTSYEWDENKAFIRGKYSIKESGKVIDSGTQMIGKDNADGVIRSWAFQADGGFGGGIWTREGRKWSVDVHGVLANGKELTATNIYIHLDPNTYSFQSVNRKLDGEQVADTQPIKVTRQKAGN